MALTVTPAIPAEQIVQILPSVLPAGGSGQLLSGMMLTTNIRAPVGALLQFPTAASVSSYFGATSYEAALGNIYFNGFNTSTIKPSVLFFTQYTWQEPVAAYLRGGSVAGLSIAQLQSLTGTISLNINAAPVSATISLAGATSFSNAASIIGAGLGITGPNQGSYVGTVNGFTLTVGTMTNGPQQAQFIGTIAGGTMTITQMNWGTIFVGQTLSGTGVSANQTVTAFLGGVGGVGTYSVGVSQNAPSQVINAYSPNGNIQLGDVIVSGTITPNLYVVSLVTGTGGVGTYTLSGSGVFGNGTFGAWAPGVTYDSIAGGFTIWSSTLGGTSTITYATGALATSLNLTQALGAVTSQGANQSNPTTFMNNVIAQTTNWAMFMTLFEPVQTDKEAFALWNSNQNNQYGYAMWDTGIVNTNNTGPSTAVGYINTGNLSGTCMIYDSPIIDTQGGQIAAFVLGYAASVNFAATQGRATAAFKQQSGIQPQIFTAAAAASLIGYGLNFYGDYTTANQAFTFFYPGSVSGPFLWLDNYIDQIWLNGELQLALMELLTTVNSIPYNQYGYGLIQQACLDPILAAVNAGVIQPGVPLSNAQAAEVNGAAGATVAPTISTRGWYLQIVPASAQVRVARTSPQINLWYTDGESVQQITLNSIDVE